MNAKPKEIYDCAILGAGVAGLNAALALSEQGLSVILIEKRAFAGGRTYSFFDKNRKQVIDNGQHLLMGCYHHTLKMLKKIGSDDLLLSLDQEGIPLFDSGKFYPLKINYRLPQPWHLFFGLKNFDLFSFQDKWLLLKFLFKLKFKRIKSDLVQRLDNQSALDFLLENKQSEKLINKFWQPLILATLNEVPEQASAFLLLQVIKRALLASKADSRFFVPACGLSELLVDPVLKFLEASDFTLQTQFQVTAVKRESLDSAGSYEISDSSGKKIIAKNIIFAMPPDMLQKIDFNYKDFLDLHFLASPIVSVNLWLDPVPDLNSMLGTTELLSQWIFKKSNYLSIIISACPDLVKKKNQEIVELCLADLQAVIPSFSLDQLKDSQVIRERWATYGNAKQNLLRRPLQRTPVQGLYLAGDWTQTQLPGTIESAAESGQLAAQALLEDLHLST